METELTTPKTRRESEVWQACDDLWAKTSSARHLTGDNIRDQLLNLGYKRGSPNEIYRYRSSWRDSRGISDAHENQDAEIKTSDPISRAVSLVYDQIRSQANDSLEQLKEDYESRLKAGLMETESLSESLSKLENLKESLELKLKAAILTNEDLSEESANIKREALILNEKLISAKDLNEAVAAEHKALILELKTFHEREMNLWRAKTAELAGEIAAQKKQTKEDLEKQGAVFSEELMSLKTMLRQANEEKEQAKAKATFIEELLKEAKGTQRAITEQLKSELADFRKSWDAENKDRKRQQRTIELKLLPVRRKHHSGRSRSS